MAQHNFSITLSVPCKITPQSKFDQFFMGLAADSKLIDFKLYHINCCRMYIQVNPVVDIAMADGIILRKELLNYNEKIKDHESLFVLPNQPDPTQHRKSDWKSPSFYAY